MYVYMYINNLDLHTNKDKGMRVWMGRQDVVDLLMEEQRGETLDTWFLLRQNSRIRDETVENAKI